MHSSVGNTFLAVKLHDTQEKSFTTGQMEEERGVRGREKEDIHTLMHTHVHMHACMHIHTLSLTHTHKESEIPRESSDRPCPGQSQAHPPDGNFILRRPWANVEVCSHGASDISRGAGTQTPQLCASEGTTPPRAVKDTTVMNSVMLILHLFCVLCLLCSCKLYAMLILHLFCVLCLLCSCKLCVTLIVSLFRVSLPHQKKKSSPGETSSA